MYFEDRPAAGRLLADKLKHHAKEPCLVLALSPGGVLIGAQISMRLHCPLKLLLSEKIILPGETEPIGAMTTGTFSYSGHLSESDVDEINGEFHGVIDTQRLEKQHKLNGLVNADTKVDPHELKDKVVVVVSDGFTDTLPLDILEDFIKPIRVKRLVIATPITSVKALDKIHLLADELAILEVREEIISVDHHYEQNKLPDFDGLIKIVRNTAFA